MVTIEPWQVWGEPLKASFQKVWDIGHMSQKDERFQGWKDCVHGQHKVFHFLSKMEVGCSLLPHQMKHVFLQTIAADKAPWSIVGMFSSKVGCSLSCPTFICVFVWLVLGCNLKQSQGYVGWFPAQSSTTLERREVEWSRVPNAISWVWYGKFHGFKDSGVASGCFRSVVDQKSGTCGESVHIESPTYIDWGWGRYPLVILHSYGKWPIYRWCITRWFTCTHSDAQYCSYVILLDGRVGVGSLSPWIKGVFSGWIEPLADWLKIGKPGQEWRRAFSERSSPCSTTRKMDIVKSYQSLVN